MTIDSKFSKKEQSISESILISQNSLVIQNDYKTLIEETSIIVIYSAFAIASSVVLLFIPNLETISFFIFFVSYKYGMKIGFQTMLTTVIVFEFFATLAYGFGGWLFLFKLIAYSCNVLIAGFMGRIKKSENQSPVGSSSFVSSFVVSIFFFILGVTVTMIFDLVTLFSELIIVPSFSYLMIKFIIGLPWFFFHEITNGIFFSVIPKIDSIFQIQNSFKN